jgi:hypothetical protein
LNNREFDEGCGAVFLLLLLALCNMTEKCGFFALTIVNLTKVVGKVFLPLKRKKNKDTPADAVASSTYYCTIFFWICQVFF